jgi:hypothetical protein
MNLRQIAVAGVSTVVAAGAFVGVTTTTASAATATSDYMCTSPLGDFGPLPVTIDVPLLPPTATAGTPIAQGLLGYTGTVVVPAETAASLGAAGVDGANANDFTFTVGSAQTVAAPGSYTSADDPDTDGVEFDGSGANEAFKLPKAGTYAVKLPGTFAFTPTSGGTELGFSAICTTADPATLGTVKISKQVSTLTAKAAKAGKKFKVTATVSTQENFNKATGKVTTKLGKKTYSGALKKGKAVISLPKAAKGKKLTINYKGDGYVSAAKGTVTVPKK